MAAVSQPPRAAAPSPQALTRIVVRPLASPLPLGFFAFGIGLVLLSAMDTHVIPASESRRVALTLLTFVAPLEIAAAVLAFLSRDTAGGTTLGLFGATWVTLSVSLLLGGAGGHSMTTAVFTFAEALILLMLAVAAISAKPFFTVLLGLATVRSVLFGVVQLGLWPKLEVVAGIVGWVTVAIAFYGGIALLLEDLNKKSVLPLFRKKAAAKAIEGELADQLRDVEREAGVREQL